MIVFYINFTSSQNREWKYFFQKIACKDFKEKYALQNQDFLRNISSPWLQHIKICQDIQLLYLIISKITSFLILHIIYNYFLYCRRRLLPNLDEEKLENKIQRRKDIKLFQQKIAGIHLEFVRPPKFSNPALLKDPIDDKLIIEEVQQRFKLQITKNHLLSMVNKINTYGQFTLQIENYYSPELQDYTTFQITVVTKKPIMKVQKLIDEVATKEEQNKDDNKEQLDQKIGKQGKEKETQK